MADKLFVAVKLGLDFYVKARYYPEDFEIPKPQKDRGYYCCNLITSLVQDFEPYKDGWKVRTMNSTYLFYTDTMENAETLARENNLPERVEHDSGSFYWGIDSRW